MKTPMSRSSLAVRTSDPARSNTVAARLAPTTTPLRRSSQAMPRTLGGAASRLPIGNQQTLRHLHARNETYGRDDAHEREAETVAARVGSGPRGSRHSDAAEDRPSFMGAPPAGDRDALLSALPDVLQSPGRPLGGLK